MPFLLTAGAAGLAGYAIAKRKERRKSENEFIQHDKNKYRRKSENEFIQYDKNKYHPPQYGNLHYGNVVPYYQPPSYYHYHSGFYYNTGPY
ncbi:unnamed protein product [Rotaria sordida]|uniref:DUF3824 domain-containing protein n=1 Tax=Rotaria sordida TaxID=392033 RepID=A0A814UK83_9BILA|nr:unnamed protein product [Rotaria sordida]CAF1220503.1 unnamed protein product [Rotaria sordida]CAF1221774.1 unnamed protein product [Rotaria sordida]CAF1500366.1 unnamed protein product [Rotaria sordida]CAF4024119.1 unnamed protein product [Rotaria sordida]